MYIALTDPKKQFDTVNWDLLIIVVKDAKIDRIIIILLYLKQEAIIEAGERSTTTRNQQRGNVSLFFVATYPINLFIEEIIDTFKKNKCCIKENKHQWRKKIHILRFADYTALVGQIGKRFTTFPNYFS